MIAALSLIRVGVAWGAERLMITIDAHRPRTPFLINTLANVVKICELLLTVKELVEVALRTVHREPFVEELWTHAQITPQVNLSQVVNTI